MSGCCFGFESSSGGTSGAVTGSGTLNYLPKWTPNGTTLGDSQLFDNGINIGLSTILPTAKFHIQGVDSTSLNYALKVDNSATSPLLYIKNNGFIGFGCDPINAKYEFSGGNILLLSFGARFSSIGIGAYSPWSILGNEISTLENTTGTPLVMQYTEQGRVGIGTNTPTLGTRLHVYRSVNDFLYEVKVENPNAGISSAASILISSNTGKMEFGQLSSTHTTYSGYGQLGDTFFRSGTGSRNINFITDPANLGKFLFFSRLNPTTDAAFPSFSIDGSKSGFNSLPDANSIVYIKGIDATSGNYALKVDNSATSPLLYVRNDGNVGVNVSTPTARFHNVGANATEFIYNFKFYNSTGSRYLQMDNDGTIESVGRLNIVWANNVDFTAFRVVAQSSQIINIQGGGNGTVCIGAGVADTNTRLHTKGVDSTSLNYAFKADNSATSNIAHFRNDQFVGFGTTTEIIGASGHKFEQNGVFNGALGTDCKFSAAFSTNNSFGIDIGAGIALGGKYNSGGLINPFAGIGGVKLNATDGNFEGRLNLWVRNGSTAVVGFTSVPFGSKVRNGMGIKNPTALLHLNGDNADVFISESGCINTTGYGGKLLANTVNTQNNIALFAQATNGLKNYAAIFEGNINTNIQTGNAGLATGDLYVDTAANILANGDLVVGRKV